MTIHADWHDEFECPDFASCELHGDVDPEVQCLLHLMEHCASCSTNPETRELSARIGREPIPGFSPDPWAKTRRVDAYRIDTFNDNVVEDVHHLMVADSTLPEPVWTRVTVQQKVFWTHKMVRNEIRWVPSHRDPHAVWFTAPRQLRGDEGQLLSFDVPTAVLDVLG